VSKRYLDLNNDSLNMEIYDLECKYYDLIYKYYALIDRRVSNMNNTISVNVTKMISDEL